MLAWHGFSAPDPASPEKARQAMATLQSSAPSADKALACKHLAVYGTAEAVPALAPLLHDEQLAAWARTALETIHGPVADQALRDAAGQLQGRLLVGVINSIGVRRDAQAVRMLISRLRGDDEAVASAAALALGRIGGDAPARILQRTLTDSRASVRSTAAQGCILCGEQFFAQKEYAKAARFYDAVRQAELPAIRIAEATRGAILARFHDGIPLLLETLRSPDQALWAIGLSTARELPGQVVTEELAVELRQTPTARQVPLLLAIADRNDEAAADVLLTQARDGEKHLRLAALAALGRLGSARATPVLLQAVGESDPELAQTAITTLAGLPADEVDPLVATRLRAASGNARLPLIRLAGQRRIAAATSDFIEAAGDADAAMRASGLKALWDTAGVGELNVDRPAWPGEIRGRNPSRAGGARNRLRPHPRQSGVRGPVATAIECQFDGRSMRVVARLRRRGHTRDPRKCAAIRGGGRSPSAGCRRARVDRLAGCRRPARVARCLAEDHRRFPPVSGVARRGAAAGNQLAIPRC